MSLLTFPYNKSRIDLMAQNRVGIINVTDNKLNTTPVKSPKIHKFLYRNTMLNLYTDYLNNEQYNHLPMWDSDISGQQMDTRMTQPKYVFPMPDISTGIINGLLTSEEARLMFLSDNINEQKNIDDVLNHISLWSYMNYIVPSLLCNGSTFTKIYRTPKGKIVFRNYNSKHCWPVFDGEKELQRITIRYIYDTGEYNENNEKIYRWHQQILSKDRDIMYDNPVFDRDLDELPKFKPVAIANHKLGIVQGCWLTTTYRNYDPDGESYIKNSLSFFDGLNYMLSKEDSSIFYNLFPLLQAYGIDPDDFQDMQPSEAQKMRPQLHGMSMKGALSGMNILATGQNPQNASMSFLENSMTAQQISEQFNLRMLQLIQYSLKTVLLDPEKIAAHAQSAKAMEALHKPVIQYTKKIRPQIKQSLCEMLEIVEILTNSYNCVVKLPKGTTLNVDKKWGNIFNDTEDDVNKKVSSTTTAVLNKVISRKTATEHLAQNFGVKNVEEELTQIDSEKADEFEDEKLMQDMLQPQQQPTAKKKGDK